jgi:hypothetical protein
VSQIVDAEPVAAEPCRDPQPGDVGPPGEPRIEAVEGRGNGGLESLLVGLGAAARAGEARARAHEAAGHAIRARRARRAAARARRAIVRQALSAGFGEAELREAPALESTQLTLDFELVAPEPDAVLVRDGWEGDTDEFSAIVVADRKSEEKLVRLPELEADAEARVVPLPAVEPGPVSEPGPVAAVAEPEAVSALLDRISAYTLHTPTGVS